MLYFRATTGLRQRSEQNPDGICKRKGDNDVSFTIVVFELISALSLTSLNIGLRYFRLTGLR